MQPGFTGSLSWLCASSVKDPIATLGRSHIEKVVDDGQNYALLMDATKSFVISESSIQTK